MKFEESSFHLNHKFDQRLKNGVPNRLSVPMAFILPLISCAQRTHPGLAVLTLPLKNQHSFI